MAQEIEGKIILGEIYAGAIMNRIEDIGGEIYFFGQITDNFYDYPDLRLNKEGKVARLRRTEDYRTGSTNSIYTEKGPLIIDGGTKKREENENEVDDTLFHKHLIFLGLIRIEDYEMNKERIEYKMSDGTKVCIDQYSRKGLRIPPLLEIEAENRIAAERVATALKFSPSLLEPLTIKDVLSRFGRKTN